MQSEKTKHYQRADSRALSILSTMCQLSDLHSVGLQLDEAERVGESVRLHVTWAGVGEGWFRLRRSTRETDENRISISLEGGNLDRPFTFLIRRLTKALSGKYLADVMAPFALLGHQDRAVQEITPINTWGSVDGWHQFLCDHAMERKLFETFRFDGPNTTITHGDLECRFITPRARFNLPRFFNYPDPLGGDTDASESFTDLQDLDVIEGGQDKLEEMVRLEVAKSGDLGPVFVNSTCVPVIIGDDVEMVLAECKAECAQGLYHMSARTVQPIDITIRFLDAALQRAKDAGLVASHPDAIALVGFNEVSGPGNLVDLLTSVGIEVTGSILPDTSEQRMANAVKAGVLVCNPGKHRIPIMNKVFRDLDTQRIFLEPPWGIEATVQWLTAIGEALGRKAEINEKAQKLANEILVKSHQNHVLGFVIEPGQENRLLASDSATGLPVLKMVLSLGFPVKICIWGQDAPAAIDSAQRLGAKLEGTKTAIASFTNEKELDHELTEVRAVFSEFFYDNRLTSRGLAQFSAGDFRMGFSGAIWSIERLQRLTNMPFYNRYSSYLSLANGRGR
ncbi:MAG TPA: nitrogenase component 1 [Myxococcota bacterium]|nr:nitrogenase component 1 [Myxococcota bacterium]